MFDSPFCIIARDNNEICSLEWKKSSTRRRSDDCLARKDLQRGLRFLKYLGDSSFSDLVDFPSSCVNFESVVFGKAGAQCVGNVMSITIRLKKNKMDVQINGNVTSDV